MNKRWLRPARKVHKWLGYLLATQIFAWLLGGLVMSAIPLDKVHGKHLAKRQIDSPFSALNYPADLNYITKKVPTVSHISFIHFLDTPIIKVKGEQTLWFDGITGKQFNPPAKKEITQQATLHYLGTGQPEHIQLLDVGPREIGYRENIWQVSFNDWQNTTIYLNAQSGELLTVRSHIWRIFDFFWMLHIMDYDERDDFNNPLLISFASFSVLFCLSGILLLLQSPPWRKRKISNQLP